MVDQLTPGRHAALATSRPDERPHATPTGLVPHHRSVWLPITGGTIRLATIAGHPWASVVVREGTNPTDALTTATRWCGQR
ncbi:pyridoxamine 5'-phosphate oxidase family protein [Micromonospora sp. LOL_025]|uniref:pyridoxamine 5'-phosphate oxidase family protein n=1 Tax=Micromonospora sp. LOL_025 TaxID=3345413 RepID=UPI003A88D090